MSWVALRLLTLVPLRQIILSPHLQAHSSLSLVPPTVSAQALGREFSLSIEAMSQLKSLEHIEEKEERWEVVMESRVP